MKRKVYSFINIFGLAIGLAICLVIWKYIELELSYDTFHKKGDHIYRTLFTDYINGEKIASSPRFGYGLGPSILQDLPEVKAYARTHGMGGDLAVITYSSVSGKSVEFLEEDILFVDSTFLDIFSFTVLRGNGSSALDLPSSIVLTESAANKYFGKNVDPIGKQLRVYTTYWLRGEYQVSAVIQDVPSNSHLDFDFLIPIHNLLRIDDYMEPRAEWDWVNFITYVEMYPETHVDLVNSKTPDLLTKYTGPNPPGTFVFTFQPLKNIHLEDQGETPFSSVYFFGLLSIFILAIAWINYINLSTARASERAREVGVKKALGVYRRQLVVQFMIESSVANFFSVLIALFLAVTSLPFLNHLVAKDLSFDFSNPNFWILPGALFLLGSFAAGVYPAFVLSSFRTANVIKGNLGRASSALSLRKALVVFQFATSLILIAGTFAIYRQISFMQDHEKGMNLDQMLIVNGPRVMEGNDEEQRLITFKNELLQYSGVKNVTSSGSVPGAGYSLITGMVRVGAQTDGKQIETVHIVRADPDFIKTYDIEILTGKSWDVPLQSNRRSVLINEAALGPFGLGDAENALQESLVIDEEDTVSIHGVFKNVHWNSLQTAHVPMLLWPHDIFGKQFSIQLHGDISESLAEIERIYMKTFPGNPLDYYFLDDFFDQQYREDRQFGKIFSVFSILAVFIACLGLWALASLTTTMRLKEISIRKVLGASISDIVSLLSTQFLKLVLIASLIAVPVVWYGVRAWLNNFAFRIGFSWDLVVLPMLSLLVIAFATIGLRTIKAALETPTDHLRTE